MKVWKRGGLALAAFIVVFPWKGYAEPPPSALATFPLGGSRGAICTAEVADSDPVLHSMFDRGYAVICRDAALPIARLYALRRRDGDPLVRLDKARAAKVDCRAPHAAKIDDIGPVEATDCRLKDADVGYRIYRWSSARTEYVAEGLAGYDSALTIGLRTLVGDRPAKGEIMVATTNAGDAAAFARVQAGTLSPSDALAEGYRRNNRGDYADASEFFVSLLRRDWSSADPGLQIEYLVNRALQQSNLGNFAEADALLARAEALPTTDQVQLRLRRNFKALHLLNQRKLAAAQAELERPMARMPGARGGDGTTGAEIDAATAAEINATARTVAGLRSEIELTPLERARVLDAQALQLHGTVLRLRGDLPRADADFEQATREIVAVRGGHVRATARLIVQIVAEQSKVAEERGDLPRAEKLLRQSLALVEQQYPDSVAARAAQARLAAYLSRHGMTDEALTLYRGVVEAATRDRTNSVSAALLAPYFALLADKIPSQPALVADFFLAGETVARPGVANTQAVLARELSAGSGDAARLFRQSVTLARDIERRRIELAALMAMPQSEAADQMRASALKASLDQMSAQQVATQAKLADYPQYRAISDEALTLADLQKTLREDEAYLKLAVVEDAVYAVYVTRTEATAYRTAIDATALDADVQQLRDTIRLVRGDSQKTTPFDVALARRLYVALLQPVADRLARINDLVFEPDGGMLRLPVTLLPADQVSVDAYATRSARPGADLFDFRGVNWLGRRLGVTTAVSARSFRDVRATPPSQAREQYLGLGQNAPVAAFAALSDTRAPITAGGIDCNFPLEAWNHPIQADELYTAERAIGPSKAEVIAGAAFSDTALIEKKDLDQFRVIHFATHGIAEGPAPGCPVQPALVTSFGGKDSDGLLTFREVYGLRIDADLVILSACDTAAGASVEVTREAGITSGGGFALDGLVRAFVGAGARTVIASHWPLPDDYRATERLISGLFAARPGTSTEDALRGAELALMDDAATSHPYYWAAFAIVGDGASSVIPQ